MNVGDLFVNLGIKGADKTVGTLTSVKKGLGEAASMSLEMKAGIVGALYALERLFSASNAQGAGLANFTALTGKSAVELQRWQFAARQVGVSAEEMQSSFMAVQATMAQMLLGKGAPEGFAMVANKVGLDPKKVRDTEYVLKKLQEFAQTVPQDVGNQMLKSFGVSGGTISAMRRNAFTPDVMNRAPVYNDQEIASLDRANAAWSNLGQKIEMAVGHFNAKHGGQLVKDISSMTDAVLKLSESLIVLGERFKVLQNTAHAIEGVGNTLKVIKELTDWMGGKAPKKGDLLFDDGTNERLKALKDAQSDTSRKAGAANEEKKSPYKDLHNIKPIWDPSYRSKPTAEPKIEVNQTLQFQHDGTDHKKNADSHKEGVKKAYRQLSSQVQGS